MLKKFLHDESKATIIDFLFWLLVYPFVIAFALACVAFIFSFSSFNDVKITDWISSLSTLFGIAVAIIGFNNWRKEKKVDLEREIFKDLINFNKDIYLAKLKYIALKDNKDQFNEISDFFNNQLNISFNNSRASVRFYLYFTKKEQKNEHIEMKQLAEKTIDPLYNELNALHNELGYYFKTNIMIPLKPLNNLKNKIIAQLEIAHQSIHETLTLLEDGSS